MARIILAGPRDGWSPADAPPQESFSRISSSRHSVRQTRVMGDMTAVTEERGDERGEREERPLLIRLGCGLISRIDGERDELTEGTGHRIPRTIMIRVLLKEALDTRERSRVRVEPQAAVAVEPVV